MRLSALPAWLAVLGTAAMSHASEATLAVRTPDGWSTWWRASEAPTRWEAPLPFLTDRIIWRPASPGVRWGELSLSGSGEAFRVRVIVVRVDPHEVRFHLVHPRPDGGYPGRWAVEETPSNAVLALNAGQFSGDPWGWLVEDGVERQRPGTGPLAPGVVVATDGTVQLVQPDSLRAMLPHARQAFQSYPTLLGANGEIPFALRTAGSGVDLDHRDSRLALGLLADGTVLIAMTRFEGLGGVLDNIPLGLTTPEMAAVMGALGSRPAVLLDGGISSQLLIRDGQEAHVWSGWRRVALGLVAVPVRPGLRGIRRP